MLGWKLSSVKSENLVETSAWVLLWAIRLFWMTCSIIMFKNQFVRSLWDFVKFCKNSWNFSKFLKKIQNLKRVLCWLYRLFSDPHRKFKTFSFLTYSLYYSQRFPLQETVISFLVSLTDTSVQLVKSWKEAKKQAVTLFAVCL